MCENLPTIIDSLFPLVVVVFGFWMLAKIH